MDFFAQVSVSIFGAGIQLITCICKERRLIFQKNDKFNKPNREKTVLTMNQGGLAPFH